MSFEAWIALSVTLLGHAINFGLLILHCRRDKNRFREIQNGKENQD